MPIDKTTITITPIKFSQAIPDIAQNVSKLTYNEGIYIKENSLSATYPKSVVRIYKNTNFPNKIYLLSKETSIIEATSKRYGELSDTEESTIINYPSLQPYLTIDPENLNNYSRFQQPSKLQTLNFDNSSLTGKTINFYTLSPDSLNKIIPLNDGTTVTGSGYATRTDPPMINASTLTANSITYSYYLRTKSIVTDYFNDEEVVGLREVNLFSAAVYYYWFAVGSISNLGVLSEDDIEIYDANTIKRTKSIDFSQYINKTLDNVWVQKIDFNIYDNLPGSAGSYVLSDVSGNLISQTEIDELKDKTLFFSRNDTIIKDSYKNRQLFTAGTFVETREYTPDRESEYFSPQANTQFNGIQQRNNKSIFDVKQKIDFTFTFSTEEIIDVKQFYSEDAINRDSQVSGLDPSNDLSTITILTDQYKTDEGRLGFVPDDLNTIVYEIELDRELDFENGTFVIVEII